VKIWFDTEFIEDGKTIDLLSIGAVREDGAMFYAEFADTDRSRASQWVAENVIPHLTGPVLSREDIAVSLRHFCGDTPEFWAYYAGYDWVALCQIYGTMMDLPKGWPMFCRDVQQLRVSLGDPALPPQASTEHNALDDAIWTRDAWRFLDALLSARSEEGAA
jgi:hypothetical protein